MQMDVLAASVFGMYLILKIFIVSFQQIVQNAPIPFGLAILLASTFISFILARYLFVRVFIRIIARSNPDWAEALKRRRVFHKFVEDIYQTLEVSRNIPIKSLVQGAKIGAYAVGGFLIIAIPLEINTSTLIATLGAMAAVISIVFRDIILGFVASIQLSANKMVAIGDWITMPEYGVDGHVQEINLTTVKVKNWDETITTVPAYSMVSHSFQNWKGMERSGGRRIMRAIYIDMRTIELCTEEMLTALSMIPYVGEHIEEMKQELSHPDDLTQVQLSEMLGGSYFTNLGLFRVYATAFLKNHPKINADMMLMVRQLEPTEFGLPLQFYTFTTEQEYIPYEQVQSDLFDIILAMVPEFGLKVFQVRADVDQLEVSQRVSS
jgi:miniconductance mechanosensitive channel